METCLLYTSIKIMAKWVCNVCGYVYEGDAAPEVCPVCKAPASKFTKQDENLTWAAEHVVGVAQGVSCLLYTSQFSRAINSLWIIAINMHSSAYLVHTIYRQYMLSNIRIDYLMFQLTNIYSELYYKFKK